MKKQNDILKHISTKETSKNFSNKVMQDIYALENEQILSNSVTTYTQKETSLDFTQSVLNKIEKIEARKNYTNIFSNWQKVFIALFVIVIILLSIFSNSNLDSRFNYAILDFSKLMNSQLINIFATSMSSLLILLVIDFFITNAKQRL